jgi:hypothetical protein
MTHKIKLLTIDFGMNTEFNGLNVKQNRKELQEMLKLLERRGSLKIYEWKNTLDALQYWR